jgi:hypothetical protein
LGSPTASVLELEDNITVYPNPTNLHKLLIWMDKQFKVKR